MPGRPRARAKLNAVLESNGAPALVEGEPIPKPLIQSMSVLNSAKMHLERAEKIKRKRRTRARYKEFSHNDLIAQLQTIAFNPEASDGARINAIAKLFELEGKSPEHQKYVIDIKLTQYAPDQAATDYATYKAKND